MRCGTTTKTTTPSLGAITAHRCITQYRAAEAPAAAPAAAPATPLTDEWRLNIRGR